MAKAVYTIIGDTVYQINQDTAIPSTMIRMPGSTRSTSIYNDSVSELTSKVWINTVNMTTIESNKEKYKSMTESLTENLTTQIDVIQNKFKISLDYSVFDETGKELSHSAVIRDIEPVDVVLPLGVSTASECVHLVCKKFSPVIDFTMEEQVPYGIMKKKSKKFVMKINDVKIYQDFAVTEEIHKSIYGHPYTYTSSTIDTVFENMALVYSTKTEGIEFEELSSGYRPRHVVVDVDIVLDDMIIAYSDEAVNNILTENIAQKYHPSTDTDTDASDTTTDDETTVITADSNAVADGSTTPDADGHYDYYERCTSTTPKALLVVEDLYPSDEFDSTTMIRKSTVVNDISDIAIGEYVLYVEVLLTE